MEKDIAIALLKQQRNNALDSIIDYAIALEKANQELRILKETKDEQSNSQ